MNNKNSAQDHLVLNSPVKLPAEVPPVQKKMPIIAAGLFALAFLAGCSSTKVTNQQQLVTGKIPRPDHIIVYDFVATYGDVPADASIAGEYAEHETPQTTEEIETGRKIGSEIAAELVEEIRSMGMPAERANARTTPQMNDIVIRGYLLTFNEGSAVKRMTIGFGSGSSKLQVAAEGFQMTAQGLQKLGYGTVEAGGSKGPGAALGAAAFLATANPAGLIISGGMKVYGEASGKAKIGGRAQQAAQEIANHLKMRFREQGWID
ncbi:hypothetical protein B188_11100 [Candidatus Brocadiaceae bacterium B188]|jgi:hypothetical protein|nr:hypothetical protein B188_11100 [Candidatus Brocadiaceae bacterium B188]